MHAYNSTKKELQKLAEKTDFIICTYTPFLETNSSTIVLDEIQLQEVFIKIRNIFNTFNPKINIIAQMGWPTWKENKNTTRSELATTMIRFWTEMSNWARLNQFPLYLEEAFDQPWLDAYGEDLGISEAAAHLGWWRRYDSEKQGTYTYIPKFQGIFQLSKKKYVHACFSNRHLQIHYCIYLYLHVCEE